jgi:hypothetical protein
VRRSREERERDEWGRGGASGWAHNKREGRGEVGASVCARARGLVVSSCVRAVKAGNDMADVRYGSR